MEDMQRKLEERIDLAKLVTLKKQHFAFIGSLLYKLSIVPDSNIPDIYLDGINDTIKVNPEWFINKLTPEESASMLAHEVLHYALQHDIRKGNREHHLYQQASDHVVNNMLMDFGFKLPEDIMVDRRYQKKDTDTVYRMLEEDRKSNNNKNPNNQNNGSSSTGNNISSSGNNSGAGANDLPQNQQAQPSSDDLHKRNNALNDADMADKTTGIDKSIGDSEEAFSELFKNLKDGKLNWRQLLAEHFNEMTLGERSFHELDRQMLMHGFFEPCNESENSIHRVAVALDVSGSISRKQIKIFLNELKAIVSNLNPEIISIMTFNTKVVDVLEFKEDEVPDEIPLDIGGGTSLEPVFKHYNKPENRPEFLVVFSDLEVDMDVAKPKYHTTWICFDNPNMDVPFGTLIHVNTEELENE